FLAFADCGLKLLKCELELRQSCHSRLQLVAGLTRQQSTSNDPAAPFSISQRGGTVDTFLGKCLKSARTFGEHRNLARQMLTQRPFGNFAEVSTANWAVF